MDKIITCDHGPTQECAECNPHEALRSDYETLIKLARRCAYDLAHVVDDLPKDSFWRTKFHMVEHAQWWVDLFTKGNPGKDYRHRLQHELNTANDRLKRLHEWCSAQGLNPPDERDVF
jgi:hypothetical protein